MKTSRRFVVFGSITLLLMVLSGCGSHLGPCGMGFHHGPWGDKGIPDSVLRRLDSKMEDLNLTPAQKEKYSELRTSLKTHLSGAKEDRKKFREAFRAEISKDAPDVAALTEAMKRKIQDVSTIMQGDLDLVAAFYGSLDATQKQKVMAGIRERMNRRHPWGEETQ